MDSGSRRSTEWLQRSRCIHRDRGLNDIRVSMLQSIWNIRLTQRRVPSMRLRVIFRVLDFLRVARLQVLETGGLYLDDSVVRWQGGVGAPRRGLSVGAWNVSGGRHLVDCLIGDKENDSKRGLRDGGIAVLGDDAVLKGQAGVGSFETDEVSQLGLETRDGGIATNVTVGGWSSMGYRG